MAPRVFRAATLDGSVYQEVTADRGATGQALLVVLAVAVATGVGVFDEEGGRGLVVQIVLQTVGWVVWTGFTYLIGSMLQATPQTRVSWSELVRAQGFAASPGVIRVLGIIPGIGIAIVLVSLIWQFIAMTVAARQVLTYTSYWKAAVVTAIGFVGYIVIVMGLLILLPGA